MKLVQVTYQKTVYRNAVIVFEVPDEFPEDDVGNLLSPEQVEDAAAGQWSGGEYDPGEPLTIDSVMEISEDDGLPHYRLENGALAKIEYEDVWPKWCNLLHRAHLSRLDEPE